MSSARSLKPALDICPCFNLFSPTPTLTPLLVLSCYNKCIMTLQSHAQIDPPHAVNLAPLPRAQPQTNPASLLSHTTTPVARSRKSTNKYTQKNNRYRDRLREASSSKLLIAKARSANHTYVSKAKAAFLRLKRDQIWAICEERRSVASAELEKCCRQHSVLSMYWYAVIVSVIVINSYRIHSGIHWVQKARVTDPNQDWPSINQVLISEGLTNKQLANFNPESKPGNSPEWDVDLTKYQESTPSHTERKGRHQSWSQQRRHQPHYNLRSTINTI